MLSRFHLIPERHGRTDRQTDGRHNRHINIAHSVLTRDKNEQTEIRTLDIVLCNSDMRQNLCSLLLHDIVACRYFVAQ